MREHLALPGAGAEDRDPFAAKLVREPVNPMDVFLRGTGGKVHRL